MVARTVQQYIRAGIAALHIEDQVQTKRCGHLLGKQVVSREEFLVRIRAAVMARDSMPEPSDFVRNAFYILFLSTIILSGLSCGAKLRLLTYLAGHHRSN
jgi:2-methylisocitrate lyase-like PEP mutase family enzyme